MGKAGAAPGPREDAVPLLIRLTRTRYSNGPSTTAATKLSTCRQTNANRMNDLKNVENG
jgi:hypothetical protein